MSNMVYSIKIQFAANNSIEASGENAIVVAKLVNEATEKFFGDTTWAKKEMKGF